MIYHVACSWQAKGTFLYEKDDAGGPRVTRSVLASS